MNSLYDPIYEYESTITPTREVKRREFVWLVPIPMDLSLIPFTSISDSYTSAIAGLSSLPTPPRHKQQIRYKLRRRYTLENLESTGFKCDTIHLQLWLLHNKYTVAKQDKLVATQKLTFVPGFDTSTVYNESVGLFIQHSLYQG